MILVDTSVWIDHFREAEPRLEHLLERNAVLAHPHVIGEIALGSVAKRKEVLRHLGHLPSVIVARHDEVMVFIERHKLASLGLGYVDVSLLASAALTPGAGLWSRDKNLSAAAIRIGIASHQN